MRKGSVLAAVAVAVGTLAAPVQAEIPGVELTIRQTSVYYRGNGVTIAGSLGVHLGGNFVAGVPLEQIEVWVDGKLRTTTFTDEFGHYIGGTGKLSGGQHTIKTVAWSDDGIRRTESREIVVVDQTPQLTVLVSGPGYGTVTSNPPGINCPGQCDTRSLKTTYTLTATPAAGSTFAGWTGHCSGTGSCTVTLNADKWVGAWFED